MRLTKPWLRLGDATGVGGEVGVGVWAGVAAAAGGGAARSISACKYAFELVYGHWSVYIAIENYSRKASRREQEEEKKEQGSLEAWTAAAAALVVWFNGMCVCCLPWGLGQLLLMAWLTRFAADRD